MEFKEAVNRVSLGVVVIGRNEGERLRTCLNSFQKDSYPIIYVDSGSTDGSAKMAQALGVTVENLDLSIPFTAARARNVGLRTLLTVHPSLEYVQFVDGDCEVREEWIDSALEFLQDHPEVAVVCGRRRERFPMESVYNLLCDLEWNTPVGEALACGGDAIFRVQPLREVGGYRDDLIAGEEPELCVRLRERGAKIVRLDQEMTWHDAAMTRFSQWRKRHIRAGHAFAEVSTIHRHSPCRIWYRETRSNYFWGLVVPTLAIIPAYFTYGLSLVLLLGYLVLFAKIVRYRKRSGDSLNWACRYAFYCVLSKFPQVWGQLTYLRNRIFRRRSRLIEYKSAGPVP